jgi:class 3 adenylate cyclase
MLVSAELIEMAGPSLDQDLQALPALALRGRKEPARLFALGEFRLPRRRPEAESAGMLATASPGR